jgi:UDP:flavonoid glycosyltransferase YjiC (YdhE family)
MRVLLSTYGSRGDVEPMVGLAAELVAAQFDAVAAAGEERGAPAATGVMPAGVWR